MTMPWITAEELKAAAIDTVCVTCGAQSGERCRTESGRTTRIHVKRWREARFVLRCRWNYAQYGCRCSRPGTGLHPSDGLSAYAIRSGGTDYPHDPSDLCRCLKVSPQPPLHMRGRSPEWSVLVDHWDELAAMLKAEHPNGTAPETYARMKALFREARERVAS